MRRYLVVAHRTLIDRHVLDEVERCSREGPATFHLLVPMAAPSQQAWSEAQVRAATERRLAEGLGALRALGLEVNGEVGDGRPVEAVLDLLRRGDVAVDEIILSTLPVGPSRWLKWDVPHRLTSLVGPIAVRHITAERSPTRI